jgi:hypothetical protein
MLFETGGKVDGTVIREFEGVVIFRVWVSSLLHLPEVLYNIGALVDLQLFSYIVKFCNRIEQIILPIAPAVIKWIDKRPLHIVLDIFCTY